MERNQIYLKTQRLTLRKTTINDAESLFSYRSKEDVTQFISAKQETINNTIQFIEKCASEINFTDTWYQLAIELNSTKEVIGDVGIHFLQDPMQCELGYMLNPKFHSKGYASESVKAVLNHLYTALNKHRIVAYVDPENHPSIKLLKRLNFRQEGHMIKSSFIQNEWKDDLIFAQLKEEWNKA